MGRERDEGVRLRDVAAAAGVSIGTASNVFNRPELVRDEARERVLAAAARLGYRGPDRIGRLLRAGKVNAIGVATTLPVSYFFDDPWARATLAALSHACDARGAGISLVSARNRERAAWNVENALVDGFVLLCVEGEGELLVRLTRRRGLPFVALSQEWSEPTMPALLIDNRGGARAAARHLAALGHRRLGVLAIDASGPGTGAELAAPDLARLRDATTRDRLIGYRQGLEEAGLPPGSARVFEAGQEAQGVAPAMAALFGGGEAPTAILAMTDRAALAAVAWLAERGLRVPQDVSVAGFDGTREAEAAGLTTVAQPFGAIAERAVEAILDDRLPVAPEVFPLALVARGSTAAVSG